jgi:ribosomal protein L11 methyltransferase
MIDNDLQVVISRKKNNSVKNNCEDKINTIHLEEEVDFKDCALLIANILTNALIELVFSFASLIRPNGKILLSGVLNDQVASVIACYSEYFSNLEVNNIDEWVRVTGTRKT